MKTEAIRTFSLGQKVCVNIHGKKNTAIIDWPTIRHSVEGKIRDWFISYPQEGENLFMCRFTHEVMKTHYGGASERRLERKAQFIQEKYIKSYGHVK